MWKSEDLVTVLFPWYQFVIDYYIFTLLDKYGIAKIACG